MGGDLDGNGRDLRRQDLMVAIGRLQGQLAAMDRRLDEHNKHVMAAIGQIDGRHSERLNNHGERIGRIERRQSWLNGASASIGAGIGILFAWLMRKWSGG